MVFSPSSAQRPWRSFLLALFVVVVIVPPSSLVQAEIIELDIVVDASSDEVHFVRGYLKAPASIDLSAVTFLTTAEPDFAYDGDDEYNEMNDEKNMADNTDDSNTDDDDDNVKTEVFVPTEPPMTPPSTVAPVAPPTDAPVTPATTEAPHDQGEGDNDAVGDQDATTAPGGDGDGDIPVDTPVPAPTDGDDNSAGSGGGDAAAGGGDADTASTPVEDTGDATTAPAPEDDIVTDAPGDAIPPTDAPGGDDGDGGERHKQRLLAPFQNNRDLEDGSAKQVMDLVLFMVPEDCKKDSWGTCDWAKLGVGSYDDEMEGGMSYCCSQDTAQRGLCNSDDIGTLIVDHSIFAGDHRKVVVPQSTDQEFIMEDPRFDIDISGDYVLVIANCNDFGLEVLALGNMEWKSVKGYLPGDLFELMLFYAALTVIYAVLALWYYCGMRIFQDAAIPIQKYILATIVIGLVEVLFRTTDFVLWNYDGFRSAGVMYTAMSLGVLKRASSRCLGVMVAMGWGVVRDSLGSSLVKIIFLGLLYAGLTLARDFFIVAADDVKTISMSTQYMELMDFAWILTILVIIINMIFYFWIISALNATTEYLRNMNQTSKLQRHMRLRCLIIISLMIIGIWLAVYIMQSVTMMLTQDLVWILEAVQHANYLFILVGVSILWRPNSQAKDYAMQMELPAFGSDDDNELELSCVVPSADDMAYDDGNDPDHQNGIQVDNAVLG